MTEEIERLTAIIEKTCRELMLPDEYKACFAVTVAGCVRDMRIQDIDYHAGNIFDAINAYEMLIIGGPVSNLSSELAGYAATTAAYFLAREAALKDKGLRALFGPEENEAH